MNSIGVHECQRVEEMCSSVLTPPLAILRWGVAGCSIIVAVWIGTLPSTDGRTERISNPTAMIGKRVVDEEGNHIGRIEDRVFHWNSHGYREYAVLSLSRGLGDGEKHGVVPSEALSGDKGEDHFVLNMNQAQLKGAPEVIMYRFYDRSLAAAYGAVGATVVTSTAAPYDKGRPRVCECFWSDVLRDTEFTGTRLHQIHVVTRQ